MENQESASTMVFKELYNNSVQTNPISIRSAHTPSKKISRNSRLKHYQPKQIEEKQLQSTEENFHLQNKQNHNNSNFHNETQSNFHLHTISDEKQLQSLMNKGSRSSKVKNRSLIVLQNILQQQSYILKLLQRLPLNNVCTMNIVRQKNIFSVDATMMMNGQQLIKSKKISGCFSNIYQIISENKKSNTLGFMKSNASGSIFNIYEQTQLDEQKLVATICYSDQFNLFKPSIRKVQMYILDSSESVEDILKINNQMNLKQLHEQGCDRKMIILKSRQPQMTNQNQYVLNFGNSNVLASVKNTIMQNSQTGQGLIKFIKVKSNQFQIKIRSNISAFLGYCFAFSSLTFKLVCQ